MLKLMVCTAITGLTGVKASTPLKCLKTVANAIAYNTLYYFADIPV